LQFHPNITDYVAAQHYASTKPVFELTLYLHPSVETTKIKLLSSLSVKILDAGKTAKACKTSSSKPLLRLDYTEKLSAFKFNDKGAVINDHTKTGADLFLF
jgi:hypothetical protein